MAFPLAQGLTFDAGATLDQMIQVEDGKHTEEHPLIAKVDDLSRQRDTFVAEKKRLDGQRSRRMRGGVSPESCCNPGSVRKSCGYPAGL